MSRACIYFLPICLAAILLAMPGMGAVIVPGSGESIQSAIDRAKPGDTVDVPAGTYQENIYVDKQIKLRGRNDRGKPTVIAARSKGEAIFLDANGCSINGFEIRNGEGCGIYVASNFNDIHNNVISDVQTGISLEGSNHNNISNNEAYGSWFMGTGIELVQSSENQISNNFAKGGWLSSAIFLIEGSNNNSILDNIANNDGEISFGINLQDSCDNLIQNNIATTSSRFLSASGISLGHASHNNTIKGNTVQGSGWKGNGINLFGSDKNIIAFNNASSTGDSESDGIFLTTSDSNFIMENNVSNNNDYGIDLLASCDNNTITNNVVRDNAKGIFIQGFNNTIYLNDFINNEINAFSWDNTTCWSSPVPVTYQYNGPVLKGYLGNRWSDYMGSDTLGDGIGDTPYVFDGGQDDYPLMELYEKY